MHGGGLANHKGGLAGYESTFALSNSSWFEQLLHGGHLLPEACTAHRPSLRLAACSNLAPAGTGTTSLAHALMHTGNNSQINQGSRALRLNTSKISLVHHDHNLFIPSLSLRPGGGSCFIMTLRDPVERLKSGLAYGGFGVPLKGVGYSLSNFVSALRSGQARSFYENSVQRGMAGLPLHPPRTSNFLVPQIAYLRGLNCSHTEIHFICTCALAADWSSLRQQFGAAAWDDAPKTATHLRVGLQKNNTRTPSSNDADAEHFVRWGLYKADTLLHRSYCTEKCA